MTISVIAPQDGEKSNSATVSSMALTYNSNVTAGNSLHVAGTWGSASGTMTCADTANGSYGAALDSVADTGDGQSVAHFKLDNTAGGANTVTVTPSVSQPFVGILIREIQGTSGYDTHAGQTQQTNPGSGADAVTSGNATPSVQPGLISGISMDAAQPGQLSAGTNFTAGISAWKFGGATGQALAESRRYTSTAPAAATFTGAVNSDPYMTVGAWFKESSSGVVTPYIPIESDACF